MSQAQVDRIVLEDGRRVAVHRLADGDTDRTVVVCHPAPGSGAFDPDPQQTWARGITLLAVDRPGYGQSDPVAPTAWASVSSAADDIAAVLDRLGCGHVGVAGWSAGGHVALALAARRPDLVDRLVVCGTTAPYEQMPWILSGQQVELDPLRGLPADTVRTVLSQQLRPLCEMRKDDPLHLLAASPADAQALAMPGASSRLTHMLEAAFAQDVVGLASDIAGYCLQPAGFEPIEVQAKTLLLYGSKDPVAGTRHGTWWQKHLPNARLEVAPGAGHLLILSRWSRALSHLAPHAKRQQ